MNSTFINIVKNDLAIADTLKVQGTVTDIGDLIDNALSGYNSSTDGSPNDDDFGLIIKLTNQTDPPSDKTVEGLIAFSSDGHIYTKYRIGIGEWSKWQLIPYMDEIDETFIKNLSISGKTVTITRGDGKTESYTTQDTITLVKGDAETTYKSGNVNITPDGIGAISKNGGNMSGALVGQPNSNYTTPQFRNITMSTNAPTGGTNGQVHFQYT